MATGQIYVPLIFYNRLVTRLGGRVVTHPSFPFTCPNLFQCDYLYSPAWFIITHSTPVKKKKKWRDWEGCGSANWQRLWYFPTLASLKFDFVQPSLEGCWFIADYTSCEQYIFLKILNWWHNMPLRLYPPYVHGVYHCNTDKRSCVTVSDSLKV